MELMLQHKYYRTNAFQWPPKGAGEGIIADAGRGRHDRRRNTKGAI